MPANANSEIRRWCHEGMYCEAEDWIKTGNPVPTGGPKERSLLVLASEKGFHSLVKLLLGHAVWPQRCLDAALARSAAGGHLRGH